MAVGQEAIDSYVRAVDARCGVSDQAHQQRPPDSRIGKQLARGQSHRIQQVARRKGVIDIACAWLAQEHANAQVESLLLTSCRSKEMRGTFGQRRLLFLIESIQNAQGRDRCVVVDATSLSTPARHALFEEIVECLVEARQPYTAHVAKEQRRVLLDELVHVEQV